MEIGHQLRALRIQKGLTARRVSRENRLVKGIYLAIREWFELAINGYVLWYSWSVGMPCSGLFWWGARRSAHHLPPRGYDDDGRRQTPYNGYMAQSRLERAWNGTRDFGVWSRGAYKTFQPSLSETFGYVLEGSIQVKVGKQVEVVSKGESFYFEAKAKHQISNAAKTTSKVFSRGDRFIFIIKKVRC